MERIICLVIGYVFGLLQTGYLVGKMNHIDIRQQGSGNAGSTNALRVMGWKAGAMTFAGDVVKCVAAVLLVRLVIYRDLEYAPLLGMYAGLGATLGHNFPFYLGFRGGKGIAATAGLVLSFNWIMAILGIITFFTTFFVTHLVSLGSLLVYVGIMIELVALGQSGYFGMSQMHLNELYAVGLVLAVMAFWKHRENIKRLLGGTERKTYLSSKQKESEGK